MSLSILNLPFGQKPGVQTRKLAILAKVLPVYGVSFHVLSISLINLLY